MPKSDFRTLKHLGKGSYGSVSLVERSADSKIYALKEINVQKMATRDRQDQLNEIRILASLYHPNIIGYYDAFIENGKLYIVTEFADSGDLEGLIKKHQQSKTKMPENIIWSVLIQSLNALKLLHAKKILHRDIKSQNILVVQNQTDKGQPIYKIADFGVSKVLHEDLTKTAIGTPYYLSPEIWRCEKYNEKTDIYSLGCLIYELCMLKHPFSGRDMKDLQKNVLRGTYAKVNEFYSQDLRDVIGAMMLSQQNRRPGVVRLLSSDAVQQRKQLCPTKIDVDVLPGQATLIANGQNDMEFVEEPQMLNTIKMNPGIAKLMQGPMGGQQYGRTPTQKSDLGKFLPQNQYDKRDQWNKLAGLNLDHVEKKSSSQQVQIENNKPVSQLKNVTSQRSSTVPNRPQQSKQPIPSRQIPVGQKPGGLQQTRRAGVQRSYK
ncbi:Kinase, NEK [Spironucleus salmonicida]|uniref:non-specific serine/threonine protein kinase n=1 Tax=Spironucleus salmonicida TaxID=348837 RepID=V6LEN4_9EUKA|nr:Kinase, NEK [Spironucleus salmonicida]|eukprot:EST42952.1 Kinase, NEK [Spironucleus salmonicida]